MKTDEQHKQITEKLKQMPTIKDTMDKEELFRRISSREIEKQTRVTKKIVPVIGTLVAIVILFAMLPVIVNKAGEQLADKASYKSSSSEDMESSENNDHIRPEDNIMNAGLQNYVVQTLNKNTQVISATITDIGLDYDIPIAFIIPKTANKTLYQDKIMNYIQDDKWGMDGYFSKDFSFEIVQTKRHDMKSSYKLYHDQFLLPVPEDKSTTVDDALREMKETEETEQVYPTIPNSVRFSTDTSDKQLTISFEETETLGNNQETNTMIEAILMTAKSYNYDTVMFENISADQIGAYNVTAPLKVPEAVNPVDVLE